MGIQPKIKVYTEQLRKKIEIVKYAEQYSIHKASKNDIDIQNIRTWKNQLPN